MTLTQWERNGWLRSEPTSVQEIGDLFALVAASMADARAPISVDTRFQTAYRGVLALCTILVRAKGYRVSREQHHTRTLEALRLVLPSLDAAERHFLQQCRKKRNELADCTVGIATEGDLQELLDLGGRLEGLVREALRREHPELLP